MMKSVIAQPNCSKRAGAKQPADFPSTSVSLY